MDTITLVAKQSDGTNHTVGTFSVPSGVDLSKGKRIKVQGKQLRNCDSGQAVLEYNRRRAKVIVTAS